MAERHKDVSFEEVQELSGKLQELAQTLPPSQQTLLRSILVLADKQLAAAGGIAGVNLGGGGAEVNLGGGGASVELDEPENFRRSFANAFGSLVPGAFSKVPDAGKLAAGTICIE